MKKTDKVSRRMFLQGAGGFTLAIPLLPSLLPKEAWGQAQTGIKRYFNVVGGYDYGHHQHWYPTLNELSQQHQPSNGDNRFRFQTLRSFAPNSSSVLAPVWGNRVNPFLNKMNMFRGLNLHTRIAHGSGHMLGNIQATDGHDPQVRSLKALPTIDQVLASTRSFTPHSNDPLHIGARYSYSRDATGRVSQVPERWTKPHQLFANLFTPGGRSIPEGGATTTTPAHPRRDPLSRVLEDYTRVRRGRSISTADGQILDNTMDRYSDILSRLSAGSTVSASGCRYSNINVAQSSSDGRQGYDYNVEQHRYAFEMYARIYAAAASCDLHRVFNFHRNIPENPFDRHPTEDFHQGHSHQPFSTVNGKINHLYMAEINGMMVQAFLVPLLTALDSFTETNGRTILDNSLVHMTIESSLQHGDKNKPCVMFGSAGGALTTGHFIDYSRRELGPVHRFCQGDGFNDTVGDNRFGHAYHGQHYNRSLTTILNAMGLQPNQYEDPGINGFFQGRTDNRLGSQNMGIARIGGYGHIGSQTSGSHWSTDQLYVQEYSRYNYNFYKNPLPLPTSSAT